MIQSKKHWYAIYHGKRGRRQWTVASLTPEVVQGLKAVQVNFVGPFRLRDTARLFVDLEEKAAEQKEALDAQLRSEILRTKAVRDRLYRLEAPIRRLKKRVAKLEEKSQSRRETWYDPNIGEKFVNPTMW